MDSKNTENIMDSKNTENCIKHKKSKEKCYHCNKKLKMIHFTCRCNHKFCVNHQNPHSHNCSFNNKIICQEAIKLNNPQTIHQKFIKI